MLRRVRDDRGVENTAGTARRRHDRRRRPSLEGLEGRQLLSADVVPATTTSAALAPDPAVSRAGIPVVIKYTPLPALSSVQGEPVDAVVASFVSNANLPADQLAAAIDWGDGTSSPGTVEASPWGGFNVRGTHAYGAETGGRVWLRVDVANAETGQWIAGVEQRMTVQRPSPLRVALRSEAIQVAGPRLDPADRPQPVRLRFVERRQRYHGAADRYVQGVATTDDLRYLKRVQDFKAKQNKGYFESLGDQFVNSLPFS